MSGWTDKAEGKVKNVTGKVTGDDKQQAEGKLQETWGDVQNKTAGVRKEAGDTMDDMQSDREPATAGSTSNHDDSP